METNKNHQKSEASRELSRAPQALTTTPKVEGEALSVVLTVIDMLDASRHAFRSRQIQKARELLETLI